MCYRDTISIHFMNTTDFKEIIQATPGKQNIIKVVQVTPGKQIIIKVLEFSLKKYFFLNYSFLNDDDLI